METIQIKKEFIASGLDYSESIENALAKNVAYLDSIPAGFRICQSQDDSYILLIYTMNGNNLLVEVNSIEELVHLIQKIILNIENCKLEQAEVCIDSQNSSDSSARRRVEIEKRLDNKFFQRFNDFLYRLERKQSSLEKRRLIFIRREFVI